MLDWDTQMLFKRQRTVPTGYAASNFLLTCFIVGLLILSLAFVYYTHLLLQHNKVFEKQVKPLAKLEALLASINDSQLQNQLSQIIKEELLTDSRLSIIIIHEQIKQHTQIQSPNRGQRKQKSDRIPYTQIFYLM